MKLILPVLLRQEWTRQPKIWHLLLLAGLLLMTGSVSRLISYLPGTVSGFLLKSLLFQSNLDLALLTDYMALYSLIFWIVVFECLRVFVLPHEEGFLALYLSKPVSPSQYFFTRLLPVVLMALGLGLTLLSGAGAALLYQSQTPRAELSLLLTGMICLGLGLVMGLICQNLQLWLEDTYTAMITAFVCWMLPILPGTLFLYRPELFIARPWLGQALAFPLNLIWLKANYSSLAVMLLGLSLMALGLVWLLNMQLSHWISRAD